MTLQSPRKQRHGHMDEITWSQKHGLKKALSKISTLNTSYEIYLLPSARDFELEPFIGKLPQP
jgi:hypothetical protein